MSNETPQQFGGFLAQLADKSDHVYWLSSADLSHIEYISPAYEKMWGRKVQDLYAHPEQWIAFMHPQDAKKCHPIEKMKQDIQQLGAAARYIADYRIIRPDGTVRWIMDRGFPIYDEHGQCCGVTGVALDVTTEKTAEIELIKAKAAEVLNNMKTEFIRNVEHDVRTPFSGLCGLSSIVWEQEQDPQNKEFLGYVVDSAQEMLNYCNEIVDFSQIESGMQTLQEKKFALQPLVEGVIKMLRPSAITKHLALMLDYDTSITTPVLRGDSRRVQRILMNLLGNAIKFTPQGQVTLKVVALPAKEARMVLIRFMVEDSGIGIPEDKQEVIFEKFTRLTLSNTGAYKGIGLGLSIVKQFTHEMGGEIDVISELHQGTTFVCTLPFRCPLSDDFVEEETRRGQ